MAGYIILKNAMDSARRQREEEEKHEKEMREKGYEKEICLVNPNFCYVHTYRSATKQTSGIIVLVVFLCLLTTMINLAVHGFQMWHFWFGAISVIGIIVGLCRIYNTTYDSNGTKEAPLKPGYRHLNTSHEPRYDWQWVKKKEFKPKSDKS